MNLDVDQLIVLAELEADRAETANVTDGFAQVHALQAIAYSNVAVAKELQRLNDTLDRIVGESSLFVQVGQ